MFKALSRLFLILTLATPLISSSSLYAPAMSGKAVFFRFVVEGALIFFLFHLLVSRDRSSQWQELIKRLKSPLVLAIGVFTGVFMLSGLTGANPSVSWWSNLTRGEGAFLVLHCFIFFVLLLSLFSVRKQFEKLLKVHIGVSLLVCFYGAIQLFSAADQLQGRIMSTLGNPSYLAGYLLFVIPFLFYFLLRSQSRSATIFWIVAVIFEIYILLWTQTRAAFLALILGGLIVLVFNLFSAGNAKRRIWLGSMLALGVAFIGIFIATNDASAWKSIPILRRATDMQVIVREFAPRLWTWDSAIAGIKERPLLGWGAENFHYAFDKYYDPRHFFTPAAPIEDDALIRQYFFSSFDRAHNIFLDYLIIGGAVLLAAWLMIFFVYYRQLMKRDKDLWFSILLAVPVVHMVQGFFFFDTLQTYLGLFLLLAFFTNCGTHQWEGSSPSDSPYDWKQLRIIPVLVLLGMGVFSMRQSIIAPLTKSRLLVTAVNTARPSEAFEAHIRALDYASPVGQKEAVDELAKFEMLLFETAGQKGDANAIPINQVRALVDAYNEWYAKAGGVLLGEESAYLAGAVNMEAGIVFEQADYLATGKQIHEQALMRAPQRLEFIRALMRVAKVQGDATSYERYLAVAQEFRPDIIWE